jgi:SpoVK/Ycf46/Vps4 family AAA+-type ATPase
MEVLRASLTLTDVTDRTGSVYMLMTEGQGFSFKKLPTQLNNPWEVGNYSPEGVSQYQRVLADLSSKTPAGRISIFDGPPGTGKTYMVRGLLTECNATAFVFVSPDQLISMVGPSFLSVLIDFHTRIGKSITFIVEDADLVITHREAGSISYVGAVLNMGDGILGQMLDIRLLFTTNARSTDLDPAIVRPGRLSAHIHVGKLEAAQCNEIYKRLTGNDGPFAAKATLAEVYQKALDSGWVPSNTAVKSKKMGFGYDEYNLD